MATDGPTPPRCDDKVFKHGKAVFSTNTIPSCAMEGWVKKVAKKSGQRVDWHFMGGTAIVKALGDVNAVKAAIIELKAEHDDLYWKTCKERYPSAFAMKDKGTETPGRLLV
jgi:hypothetical protein